MHRSLLVAATLTCLPACQLPTGPGLVQPTVTGEWSGTFESSWGVLPVRASLKNEPGSTSVYGDFTVEGRATGKVSGLLQTRDRYSGTTFWGSLTISYLTAAGDLCRSESPFAITAGRASDNAVDIFTAGFPNGNCADAPTQVHLTLRR